MVKLNNKFTNYTAALKRLREAITAYKNEPENELYRDALIQRFEFSFELAWKTLAEFLTTQGIAEFQASPKSVFKTAYGAGYIEDEETWLNIIEDRNFMSHTYDGALSERVADDICYSYEKAMTALLKTMQANV